MELDPIETFLQQGTKRFSLSMLINAHSRLSILQMNKGSIALEDIIQSLSLTSTVEISSVELNAHAALIYEGTLVPVLTSKGPVLRLNKEMIANDANFLKGILNVMFGHAVAIGAGSNAVVEEFRNEAMTFLKRSTPSTSSLPSALAATGPTTSSPGAIPAVPTAATAVVGGGDLNAPVEASVASTPETLVNGRPPSETTKASPTLLADAPPFQPSGFNPLPTNTSMVSPVPPNSGGFGMPGMTNPRPASSLSPLTANPGVINPARVPAQFPPQVASPAIPGRPNPLPGARPLYPQEEIDSMPVTDVERTEPVANLLAHIRKEGMDILFPPIIHDKVLMAVFAAMRSAAPLAHRELIDMVMAVKEAAAVNQLENLSRNKVRGILALLKHAQLFITHGADGDAVRLHLANGVNTFRDLRDRHDAFLNRYMILHHLFIPVTLKCDLVWQLDMETKNRRLEELKSLEFVLLDFFKTYYLGARGLKTTTGPLPPSNQGMGGLGGVPSGDYGGPNYGNKMRDMRYEGELTDDRYRYLDQANNSAQIYDPYNRKPPTHPNQAGGNLVYSTGRPVGSSVVSSAGAIPSGVTRPYGAIPASSSALSYNNQNYTPNNYRSLQSAPVSAVPPRVPPSAGYRGAESEYSAMGLSPQTFHKVSEGGGPSVYGSKGYSVPVDRGGVLDGLTGGGGGGGVVGGYNYYGLEDPNDERYSMRSSLGGHQSMNGGSGLTGSESSSLYGNAVGGLLSGGKKDILSAFADPYSSRDAGSSWNVPTFATEEAPASIKNEPSWATSSSNWYSTASDPVEGVSSSSFNAAPTLSSTSTTNSNTPAATATGPPPGLSSTSNNNNTANTFINVATGLSEAEQLDSLISDDQELVIPDPSTITINVKETLQNSSEPVIADSETFPE